MTEPAENVIPLRPGRYGSDDDPPHDDGADPADDCPVQAIGHVSGTFHFLDASGQPRALSATALGRRSDLDGLFLGDPTWMEAHHPQRRSRVVVSGGETQIVTDEKSYSPADVAKALIRACRDAGYYGPHIVTRKSGVWPGKDGRPVVHVGRRLLHNGRWYPAGRRIDDTIWAAGPQCAEPGDPCPVDPGRVLVDRLRTVWNWTDDGAPIVVAGLIAAAYYGGAPAWRPSGFITGPAQSGKTLLMEAIAAALPISRLTNDTTAAGITGMLDGHAMPTVIDEASDRDPEGARKLMDIVLASVSGEGVRGLRGTAEGGVRTMSLAASFIYGSTARPPLGPTHLGRITIVELAPALPGRHGRADMTAFRAWCKENGPGLWGRMLARWDEWRQAGAVFSEALLRAGCAPREVDQMSAVLAGFWTMTQDNPPDATRAREVIGSVRGFIRDAIEVRDDNNPAAAARWLLSRTVQWDSTTRRKTVAELLLQAWEWTGKSDDERAGDARAASDALGRLGMRPIREWEQKDAQGRPIPRLGDGDAVWLLPVAVAGLFRESEFGIADRWRTELGRLDRVHTSTSAVRVGGVPGKCIWVPRAALFEEEAIPWAEVMTRYGLTYGALLAMVDRPADPLMPAQRGETVEEFTFDPVRVAAWLERHGNVGDG